MNAVSNPPISEESRPKWLSELSEKAWLNKDKHPLPLNKEAWRKIDLSGFTLSEFSPETSETLLEITSENSLLKNFFDLSSSEINSEGYSEVLQNISESIENIPDIFAAANIAKYQKGFYIKGSKTPDTVRITHSFSSGVKKGSALMHRIFIHVPENCELTVVEEFKGTPSENISLWNNNTTVLCENNSKLNYISIGNYADNEYHFHNFTSHQKRDSSVHVSVLHGGGISGKSFYTAGVNGTGAHFRGIGLGIGMDREYNDLEMCVEHYASHSESSLYYRTVQKDRSHSVFTGNLVIPKGLKNVSSHQLNNNILLDKRARAESIPQLIIKAESVKCDHGSTVGEINEEALLYLKSRGIPEMEAKSLLVEGFATEIIDEIPLEEIRDRIREEVMRKLSV